MKFRFEDLLLKEGILKETELEEVKKIQQKSSADLTQILLKKGILDDDKIARLKAKEYSFDFLPKIEFNHDKVFESIPLALIQKYRMVPVNKKGKTVTVALSDPSEIHAMDDLHKSLRGYKIKYVVTTDTEIMRLIHSHFDETSSAAKEVLDGIADDYSDLDFSEENFDAGNEAPIIRMVNAILNQGIQEGASDIHVEPYEKRLDIRYRIDGILHKRLSPPRSIHSGLVSRIKIMAHLNIAENRLPQDGRIKLKLAGKDVDIRVSSIPTRYGERVVMRLLNKSDINYSINTLGFLPAVQKSLINILKEPNGIVLVTGPTGSGKTTTLYAFLTELNDEVRNIITVEDPVEYEIEGISQMQMQEKIGLTFASALRSILRQDPDVVMVGEIRDKETAKIAIQASLTG
ncbi:MAG: ATPase, T2SS/T4P/T4SS family, partial [Spirochaetia bacterium]|nr:ATPase, T2SS/T4P/T4SS family [Spirochaetia bacterium]